MINLDTFDDIFPPLDCEPEDYDNLDDIPQYVRPTPEDIAGEWGTVWQLYCDMD